MRTGMKDDIMHAWYKKKNWRFIFLLASLLLLIILFPLFDSVRYGGGGVQAISSVIMLLSIYAISDNRRNIIIGLILAIPAFAGGWASYMAFDSLLSFIEGLFSMAFYGFTTVIILRHVVSGTKVTKDTISGAVCVYLLMGITWGTAYKVIEEAHPGSFYIDPVLNSGGILNFSDFIYFSFVTLTTTGFGDILPLSGLARSLTILETVTGVLFVAVLMARLVGMLGQGGKTESDQE